MSIKINIYKFSVFFFSELFYSNFVINIQNVGESLIEASDWIYNLKLYVAITDFNTFNFLMLIYIFFFPLW